MVCSVTPLLLLSVLQLVLLLLDKRFVVVVTVEVGVVGEPRICWVLLKVVLRLLIVSVIMSAAGLLLLLAMFCSSDVGGRCCNGAFSVDVVVCGAEMGLVGAVDVDSLARWLLMEAVEEE